MLQDKVVVLSGAAGSLGPAVARAFLAASAKLVIAGRSLDKLGALAAELGGPAGRVTPMAVDLGDETATRTWVRALIDRFGRIDVVVHMVGGYRGGKVLAETPMEDWEFLDASLVRTTLNLVRAVSKPLASGSWGRFIAVTSPRALAPTSKGAVYAAAKSASDALVLALADELRGTGATANLVAVESIEAGSGPTAGGPAKAYGKTTTAEQIAAAMLYLCSDEAAIINGVRLPLIGRGI